MGDRLPDFFHNGTFDFEPLTRHLDELGWQTEAAMRQFARLAALAFRIPEEYLVPPIPTGRVGSYSEGGPAARTALRP